MKTITNSTESDRREAAAWLAGALRWERVLDALREDHAADVTGSPILVEATATGEVEPAHRREAA